MAISNDKDFKATLAGLPVARQRQVAARFVQRVFDLSKDVRVKAALEVAGRADISDAELTVVSAAANTARVESFTQCGKETDWSAQAGLFVAKAAVACVRRARARQQPGLGRGHAGAHGAHLPDRRHRRGHREPRSRGAVPHPRSILESVRKNGHDNSTTHRR